MYLMVNAMDCIMVLLLVFLEGILSLDNAVVLAVTVKHLPPDQQKKALSYGICGAFFFRFLALFFITQLIKLTWLKVIAGLYLVWLGASFFLFKKDGDKELKVSAATFWRTILTVELLDIVFSMDSIFAAVGLGQSLAIIFLGGALGILMMRFAANYFVLLIEKYQKLENCAYGLIIAVGVKLGMQALFHI